MAVILAACGGGDSGTVLPPSAYTASAGVAQKGPLLRGSTVTVQELDVSLSPTGKQYSYQVSSDFGTFTPTSAFGSRYIGLIANGYYLDEVASTISTGTITLNGYSDLASAPLLNVNLLTTLAYQRIQHLVTGSSMTFAAAKAQAESEVLTALNIPNRSAYGGFDSLDLSGGRDGDQILAAISSLFVYGNSAGPLSSLIASFQADIGANGVITNPGTKTALAAAAKALDPAVVAANLTQAYSSAGVKFSTTNISDWIDQDGDGVIGKFKFRVAGATPSSIFTFPSSVVSQADGTSVSTTAGQLLINGTVQVGPAAVKAGDVISVSPGVGSFQNGLFTTYLLTGTARIARVSFISGLLSITVTPASATIAKGQTQQFTATGTFSDISTADMTHSVVWTSGSPSVATMTATSGLARAVSAGTATVTAASGAVTGTSALTVTPAVLQSLSITPNPIWSGPGMSMQLTATGVFSDFGSADVTRHANWSSGALSVVTVGPTTGLTKGVSLGTTTITATMGSIVATVPLAVVINVWSPTGALALPHSYHTATLLPSGNVFVAGGGYSGDVTTRFCELYDTVAGAWTFAASSTSEHFRHSATLLPDGRVLVAGGQMFGLTRIVSTAEVFDPASNSWSQMPSLKTGRAQHTATLLPNGRVLVAGGYVQPLNMPTETAELFDPSAFNWSKTGGLLVARFAHTATLLPNGKVLVTGGTSYDGGGVTLASAELYDPVSGTWSATGSLSRARTEHTATLLPNGKVLVAGGFFSDDLGSLTLASAELYDPATGSWSVTGSLSTARTRHTTTLLPSGKVLVAGGIPDSHAWAASGSAELYDPVTGSWSAAGSLSTVRSDHTATLLPNGVVLVVGGFTGLPTLRNLASAELYW